MTGTSFSVTAASRCTPPRKITAQTMTSTIPTIQEGMPNAVSKVEPMELDWTLHPHKAQGQDNSHGKKPARNFPKPPRKAVVM